MLWLYRTISRSSTRETPFSLTYDIEAVLPPEILVVSLWVTDFDMYTNDMRQCWDLYMLEKKHEAAQLCQVAYKARTENYYNWRVQVNNLKLGEWVVRKNESSHARPQGKLRFTEEGPYKILETH